MKLIKPSTLYTILEASLFVAALALSVFFPVIAAVTCGLGLAVISFREYGYQREVLKGKNKNTAVGVGYKQILLCSMIFITLLALAANPVFAPVIPFIQVAWGIGITISIVSALCAGGYEKLRHDWKQSGIPPLKWIIEGIDFVLQFIPEPIANSLGKSFARLHRVLGDIFFTTQIIIFVIVGALIQPALGLAALGYLGLSYLRTENALPLFIVNGLERLDAWMGQVGGFFVPDPLMQLYSYYSIASSFVLKFASPLLTRFILGTTFDGVTILANNDSDAVRKPTPILSTHITKEQFQAVLERLPTPPQVKNNLRHGLEKDIDDLYKAYEKYHYQHEKIKARNIAYAEYKQLLAPPKYLEAYKGTPAYVKAKMDWYWNTGIRNYVRYAMLAVPMRAYWYFTSFWYSPSIPNEFLTLNASKNPYAINLEHLSAAPFVLPEAPEVDFEGFIAEVKQSNLEERFSIIKASCLESPQFQSVNATAKEDLEDLQAELTNIYTKRRELKELADTPQNKAMQEKALLAESNKIQLKIDAVNNMLISYWHKALRLPENATEEQIFTQYIVAQLEKVCNTIETGSGLGWDKSGKSLEDVQTAGKHVIKFCYDSLAKARQDILSGTEALPALKLRLEQEKDQLEAEVRDLQLEQRVLEAIAENLRTAEQNARLAQINDDLVFELQQSLQRVNSQLLGPDMYDLDNEEANPSITDQTLRAIALGRKQVGEMHSLIIQLAVDAGDYCAAGVSDAIFRKYDEYLANKFIDEADLPLEQKVALNMQCYRRNVFNGLYTMLARDPRIKALFFHIDFYDQHDRAYIMHAVRMLCLEQHNIARNDSSKEGTDFLKEISAKLVAFTLIRLLIACENGYSPEGIINSGLLKLNESTCYKAVNRDVCLQQWKDKFNDEIYHYIDEVWTDGVCAMGSDNPEEQYLREKAQKLLALMLLDNGVFKLNHQEDKEAIAELLKSLHHVETTISNPQAPDTPDPDPGYSLTMIFRQISNVFGDYSAAASNEESLTNQTMTTKDLITRARL